MVWDDDGDEYIDPSNGRPIRQRWYAPSPYPARFSAKACWGEYSIDDQDHYPRLRTYGLERLLSANYIGGLGSTIVAAPAAAFHARGLIRTATLNAEQARAAADLFTRTEQRHFALDAAYQLAAVAVEARRRTGISILVNISSRGRNSMST